MNSGLIRVRRSLKVAMNRFGAVLCRMLAASIPLSFAYPKAKPR
nr:hypothetical protein [Xenorhabdus bovienii]